MLDLITSIKETTPLWIKVSAGSVLAFVITIITIPTIVRVAHLKNLCAQPNKRTSHANATPNLGGIALFIGFLIPSIIVAGDSLSTNLFYVISGLFILFFIGMKDDVLIIDPKKKLAAQIVVAIIVAILADIKIVSLFEIFNIGTISYFTSIVLTVIFILLIINGFNLIDGIDGLAAGAGILTSVFFGIWFWNIHNIAYTVICFSLTSSLAGFFLYNVFGKKNKIFLGDTGSLILGLTISVLTIQFLNPELKINTNSLSQSSPALAAGLLILPLFDTMRVFIIRIFQGKSPFIADRQHLHHLLLALGFSHLKSTTILLSVNFFFIVFCFYLQDIGNMLLLAIVFSMATLLSYLLVRLVKLHQLKSAMADYLLKQKAIIDQNADLTVLEPQETELLKV